MGCATDQNGFLNKMQVDALMSELTGQPIEEVAEALRHVLLVDDTFSRIPAVENDETTLSSLTHSVCVCVCSSSHCAYTPHAVGEDHCIVGQVRKLGVTAEQLSQQLMWSSCSEEVYVGV